MKVFPRMVFFLASMLALASSAIAQSPALEELLDRVAEAHGYLRTELPPGCFHTSGTLGAMGMSGQFESWTEAPARTRFHLVLGPLELEMGSNGHSAWMRDRNGTVREAEGHEREELLLSALVATGAWLQKNPPVALRRKSDAEEQWVELSILGGEISSRLHVDPESGLILRQEILGSSVESEIWLNDYRPVAGIQMAHHSHGTFAGDMEMDTRIHASRMIPARGAAFYRFEGEEAGLPPSWILPDEGRSDPLAFARPGRHIFLPAMLPNGKEGLFLLDSGAATNILDQAIAELLGLKTEGTMLTLGAGGRGEASFATLDSLRVGGPRGLKLGPQSWAVSDLGPIAKMFGMPLAGVLGYDLFRQLIVELDYPNRRVIFHSPNSAIRHTPAGDATPIPLRLDWNLPSVEVLVDGQAAWVHLDTGSNSGLDLAADLAAKLGLKDLAGDAGGGLQGLGGVAIGRRQNVGMLTLGPLRWENPPVQALEAEAGIFGDFRGVGILGGALLGQHHFAFDYGRRTLWLLDEQP